MDFKRITQQEGCRREDLNKEHQEILRWLDILVEDLDNLKDNIFFIDEEAEEETIIGNIKREIILNTIDSAIEWLDSQIAEYQVAFRDNE